MPNYVINEMHVRKNSELDNFFTNLIKNPETEVFNSLIPMPEELNNGEGWYRWRLAKWGTKWDVSGADISREDDGEDVVFRFDTAWNTPMQIIETLAYEHDGFINLYFADEDLGYNCGEIRFEKGLMNKFLEEVKLYDDYEENKAFAIKLWRREDEFDIIDGKYEYKEWA